MNLTLIISWKDLDQITTFFNDLSRIFPNFKLFNCPFVLQSSFAVDPLQLLRTSFPKLKRFDLKIIDDEDFEYFMKYLRESQEQFEF
jgi:hypothetical protein